MTAALGSALLVLAAASFSAGLGWSGLLLLRHRALRKVSREVLVRSAGFALVRLARAACIWLALTYLIGEHIDPLAVGTAVAIGAAPLMLAFLHFVPHFGWIVLGLLEAISFSRTAVLLQHATGRSQLGSVFVLGASWLLVWLAARLLESGFRSRRPGRAALPHPRRLNTDEVLASVPAPARDTRTALSTPVHTES